MIEFGQLVEAIGALVAVLGLVVATGLVLRRIDRSRFGQGRSAGRLEVLAQRALDPRTRIVLLRCDSSEHLIVIGAGGCTRLPLRPAMPPTGSQPGPEVPG